MEDGCKEYSGGDSLSVDNVDLQIVTKTSFVDLIRMHDVRALISIFLPPKHIWKTTIDFEGEFSLDMNLLRAPFSKISNTAFGCAKIFMEKEHLIRKSKKLIVASMRYLLFGIQIAKHGKIVDYQCANEFFQTVMEDEHDTWHHYQHQYRPQLMKFSTEFRSLFLELLALKTDTLKT